MNLTIVIPTYNRGAQLISNLRALEKQTEKRFSVIIVNDGSTDNTEALIQAYIPDAPFPIRFLQQQNAGAAVALNYGIDHAPEGLVLLLDDDIIPLPDLLQKHLEHHQKYPGSIVSGSAAVPEHNNMSDIDRYQLFMEQEWKKKTALPPFFKISWDKFVVSTANTSFTKHLFHTVGGFNPSLRDGYDVEFHLRALSLNVPIYYSENIRALHMAPFSLQRYAKRQKAYIESKKQIASLHPQYAAWLSKYIPPPPSTLKRMIYSFLKNATICHFVDTSPAMQVLPRKVRYKIYGMTIAALAHQS